MSWQAVEAVIRQSKSRGSARMVLIAIAYHADAERFEAYPSIATIASEANISERSVEVHLNTLVNLKELSYEVNRGRSNTNFYTILLPKFDARKPVESCNRSEIKPVETCGLSQEKPAGFYGISEEENPQVSAQNPQVSVLKPAETCALTVIEPSIEPSIDSFANAQESPRANSPEQPQTESPPKPKRSKLKNELATDDCDLPDCIPRESWSEWLDYRKTKREPVSVMAAQKQIKFLVEQHARGQPASAIIEQSIRNDWQGLFSLKEVKNGSNQANSNGSQHSGQNRQTRGFDPIRDAHLQPKTVIGKIHRT